MARAADGSRDRLTSFPIPDLLLFDGVLPRFPDPAVPASRRSAGHRAPCLGVAFDGKTDAMSYLCLRSSSPSSSTATKNEDRDSNGRHGN